MTDAVAIVAAIIRDARGHLLLVRKRRTVSFMQPGGKREAGEDDLAALARELEEELGCGIVAGSAVSLGRFKAPAANEAGREVIADVWSVAIDGAPAASAEIAEMIWLDTNAPGDTVLAPLTRDHVLPLVRRRAA
ncbi:MAG TPA: NUDIX domain-containing protein [Bauldia sp.]|nr:NUDIX domain-containing protein [Bauldia sp.]